MICTLTIVRYPRWLGWAGLLSMALFRLPLLSGKDKGFFKLMGCGKNGTFSKMPDWRQWAVLHTRTSTPSFITAWWRFFRCKVWQLELEPIEGHGSWNGKTVFGALQRETGYEGPVAVLTRATIRLSALKRFWQHVQGVSDVMQQAEGFVTSVGIGEVPWIRQATFSIWESKAAMKAFAYRMREHAAVVTATRKEKWYSEDLFVRFRIHSSTGGL